MNYDASGNPVVRFDVNGNQVDAHGGEIRKFGDRYYWYSETYGCGFEWQKHAPSPFCGFRVYTSPNLTDWTDGGLLFDVSQWEPWQARCHWWTLGCFRPHVIYNEKTGKYVLWVNTYDQPVGYHVLVSTNPMGPFEEVALPKLAFDSGPAGKANNGDQNLFVDEDGTAYIVYAEWYVSGGDLVVERLTPDYLSGTGEYVRVGAHHTEAPSLFKRNGTYYVMGSSPPNWAYGRSASTYFTASSPLGPYGPPVEISRTTCGGQAAHVVQLPTKSGGSWYLYQVDLWVNSDGVGEGDANQAPAPQFWAPLTFRPDGSIAPLSCEHTFEVNAWTASPPNPTPPAARIQCDIGAAQGSEIQREFRISPRVMGRLASVDIPVYQRGEPDAPLVLEIRSEDGSLLKREEVKRQIGNWEVPPVISWAARKLRFKADVTVARGTSLAFRLRSSTTRGCYGFAFVDGVDGMDGPSPQSWVSSDGGANWRIEPQREPRMDLNMD